MRRFLAFAVMFVFSLPVGLSIAGCGHNPNNYCVKNGHTYGQTTSQAAYATLGLQATGLSLSWGQTLNVGSPSAFNCNGGAANVSHWTYSSSDLLLADISPTGLICAGTWNRNSPGGTTNFTICTPPAGSSISSFSGCNSTSCGIAQVTASGGGVTTNPVNIYIHPPITSMTIPDQSACLSQGSALSTSLLAETTVTGPGGTPLCGPAGTVPASIPSCISPSANIGTINYGATTTSVVNINNTTNPTSSNPVTGSTTTTNPNGIATANLPGSTIITATSSNVTSAAGFFSTCPPASIALSVNGATTATVTASSPQTVLSAATDTNKHTINGLALNYSSTEPQNLTVNSTGVVSATFPSHASVSAVCQPPTCNQSPINLVGLLGNGMPVASNILTVNSPGRVSNQIWMASSQSQYFSEVDLTTGTTGAPVFLPYPPNSMVMDPGGNNLYFGSYYEMMMVSTKGNQLAKEFPGVPGVVLAVNPSNTEVIVNDQLRQVIYLFGPLTGATSSISGVAFRAQFSPDGTTAYIVGQDPATGQNTLFVNNVSTGWTSYPLTNQLTYTCPLEAGGSTAYPAPNPAWDPFCGPSVAISVPSVAAFLSGNTTAARSFCPNGSSLPPYYPPAGNTNVDTAQLTATADGNHVLGANTTPAANTISVTDIGLYQNATPPLTPGVPVGACPAYGGTPLALNTSFNQGTLPIAASEIDQVVSSPYSSIAFVTYQSSSATGLLPYYMPGAAAPSGFPFGSLGTVQLSTGAGAPVAGAFAPDGSIFFTSTSSDNLVHMVDTTTLTDTQTINPNLTNSAGVPVPAQFLAIKSRATT
jgi:trimeric autotransporter adhesin